MNFQVTLGPCVVVVIIIFVVIMILKFINTVGQIQASPINFHPVLSAMYKSILPPKFAHLVHPLSWPSLSVAPQSPWQPAYLQFSAFRARHKPASFCKEELWCPPRHACFGSLSVTPTIFLSMARWADLAFFGVFRKEPSFWPTGNYRGTLFVHTILFRDRGIVLFII